MPRVSALPAASALDGSELEAVVQSGTTKKTTQADKIKQLAIKQVAYSPSIPFDWPSIVMAEKTVDANITITPNTTGAIPGAVVIGRFIGNGSNTLTIGSGFQETAASDGFDNTTGTVNYFYALFDGTDYQVVIKQRVAVVPVGPYALFADATSSSDSGVINTAGVITTTNTNVWGNNRVDNKRWLAGTTVRIKFIKSTSSHVNIVVGFLETSSLGGYNLYKVGVNVNGSSQLCPVENGSIGTSVFTASSLTHISILVEPDPSDSTKGIAKLETSPSGVDGSWTTQHTFTNKITAQGYPSCDILGSGASPAISGTLNQPTATGLSV